MSFLSFLFPSSPETETSFNQSEREALVDLLYLGIYADNHLSQTEENALAQELDLIQWDSPQAASLYVNDAIVRARDARSNSDFAADYLADIANRLANPAVRAKALGTLDKIIRSDGTNEKETAFLDRVRAAFKA